jgi:hypothetical protein
VSSRFFTYHFITSNIVYEYVNKTIATIKLLICTFHRLKCRRKKWRRERALEKRMVKRRQDAILEHANRKTLGVIIVVFHFSCVFADSNACRI